MISGAVLRRSSGEKNIADSTLHVKLGFGVKAEDTLIAYVDKLK